MQYVHHSSRTVYIAGDRKVKLASAIGVWVGFRTGWCAMQLMSSRTHFQCWTLLASPGWWSLNHVLHLWLTLGHSQRTWSVKVNIWSVPTTSVVRCLYYKPVTTLYTSACNFVHLLGTKRTLTLWDGLFCRVLKIEVSKTEWKSCTTKLGGT